MTESDLINYLSSADNEVILKYIKLGYIIIVSLSKASSEDHLLKNLNQTYVSIIVYNERQKQGRNYFSL